MNLKFINRIRQNTGNTIAAGYIGYVTQAIVNNIAPLLFVTFQSEYGISIGRITFLATFNFTIQLLVDFLSAKFIHRIGYRTALVMAHISATIGLAGLGIFPGSFPYAYAGMLISIFFYAIGGGLIEVLISPMVEAATTDKNAAAMSILHSFYCWGQVLTILLSTVYFYVFGIEHWKILVIIWALVPLFNTFYCMFIPINTLEDKSSRMPIRELVKIRVFWILVVLMIGSGASELAMSQWASSFAEIGLNVSKSVGDILGPCMFAVLMGISRMLMAKLDGKVTLEKIIMFCALLCAASYVVAALSPYPGISLAACSICGFSVGVFWPGTYSLAAKKCRAGGTAMFALLALAGDIGCSSGPTLVGGIAGAFNDNLSIGLIAAIIFPALMIIGTIWLKVKKY